MIQKIATIGCLLSATGVTLSNAAITIAGSSTTEIVSQSSGQAAATYEVGYFDTADTTVPPDGSPVWGTFTVVASLGEKNLGIIDQTGGNTPSPGQFAFSNQIDTRADAGPATAADYSRRLAIRFYNADRSEFNTVTAANNDWLLNDPEDQFSFGADLNLTDPDIAWEFAASPFTTVPEPSSTLLCALSLIGLTARRRRS